MNRQRVLGETRSRRIADADHPASPFTTGKLSFVSVTV